MQKKLIAVAVAGLMSGVAFAQTNVTISGLARMSYNQDKVTGLTAAQSSFTQHNVSDQSSMLVFGIKEDLGGGMYAKVQIDSRWSGDNGTKDASGNTHIALGGNWGMVAMGRQDLHFGGGASGESYKAYTLQNILGNSLFTQVNGTAIAVGSRTPNVIWYDSPSFSGLTVRVAMSTSRTGAEGAATAAANAADPNRGGAFNFAVNYANGPIKAGWSRWNSTNEGGTALTAATADQRGDSLSFGYAFPMGLKVGVAWNRSTLNGAFAANDQSRTAWLLPISYDFGNSRVNFTYAKANAANGVANSDAKAWTLAYGYSLSKRTNVGVGYTKLDNNTGASYNLFGAAGRGAVIGAAGNDISQFSLNVNHAF